MNNKLGSMVINNPRRRGWGYRIRDAALVGATLALWCLFAIQAYHAVMSSELLMELAFLLAIFKLVAIHFVAVFMILHAWVSYERLLFRKRAKAWSSKALPDSGHAVPANTRSSPRAAEHSL